MPQKIRFDELPESVRGLDPETRAALLRSKGYEIDDTPQVVKLAELPSSVQSMAPSERSAFLKARNYVLDDGNPFSGIERQAAAGDSMALAAMGEGGINFGNESAQKIARGGARAAMGALPVLATGGGALPAALGAAVNAKWGPEATSGHGIGNAIVDTAAGAANPFLGAVSKLFSSPARSALSRAAGGAAQVGAAEYLGDKIAAAKGEQTQGVNPLDMLIGGGFATAVPAIAGRFADAIESARTAAEKTKVAQLAREFFQGARLSPGELSEAQKRITQALGQQGAVEAMTPAQRMLAGVYAPEASAAATATPRKAPASAQNPFRDSGYTSDGLPLKGKAPAQPAAPQDDLIARIASDDNFAKELQTQLLEQGKVGELKTLMQRLSEYRAKQTTAGRAAATDATGLDFRRVDEGRPTRAKITPEPVAIPEAPAAPPAPLQALDKAAGSMDPKRLASLAPDVKETLAGIRQRGVAQTVQTALSDPAEFANLPKYIDTLEQAFPEANARRTIQAQIAGDVLGSTAKGGGDNLKMIERLRGMGEDRAKVINSVFGSQDAYRNLEALHDAMEASARQEGAGTLGKLKMFFNRGDNGVLGVPLGGVTFYLSSAMLGTPGAAVAGAASAYAGGKLITIGMDKLAEMIASNRTKTMDVIRDLAEGTGRYTPQTVNQILGGLRRRASDERDLTAQQWELLQSQGLR